MAQPSISIVYTSITLVTKTPKVFVSLLIGTEGLSFFEIEVDTELEEPFCLFCSKTFVIEEGE